MDIALITAVCLTQFMTSFMGSSLNVAVEALATDFAVQPQMITWVINAFTVMTASFLLCSSAIAGHFGYRKTYSTALLLSALSCFALVFCPNFMCMLIGRALQGVVFSLIFCTSMAILVANISKEKRAVGIGLATASVYGGLSLSPVLAGFLIDLLTWRSVFVLAGAGLSLAFILSLKINDNRTSGAQLKFFDLALSFAGVMLILLSLSLMSYGNVVALCAVVGIAVFCYFLYRQSRQEHPLVPVGLMWRNHPLRWALVASVFNYMANFSLTFLLSLHMQYVLGLSASMTGLLLIVQPLMMMTLSTLSGRLSAAFNVHILTLTGMTMIGCAFVLLHFLEPTTPLLYMMCAQFICGVGFGLFSAPNTNIVMSSVTPDKYALVSALQALTRTGGQACSMAAATWLLNHFIDAVAGTTLYIYELSYTISFIFVLSAAAAFLGSGACLLGFKAGQRQRTV